MPGAGLTLDEVQLGENAVVQFSEIFCRDIEPTSELETRAEHWRCADTESFRVCADVAAIGPGKWGTFSYLMYVRPRVASGFENVCECRLSATPIGSFLDQEGTVDFQVARDGTTESGTLRLPLHSSTSGDFLVAVLDELPKKISIGRTETIWVGLRSQLTDLDVIVMNDVSRTLGKPALWEDDLVSASLASSAGGGSEYRIPPGGASLKAIRLDLRSRRMDALGEAFLPYGSDKAKASSNRPAPGARPLGTHDSISLHVPYRTDGGEDRTLIVEVPIRFQPSPWLLLLAVVLGALVARALQRLRSRSSWRSWLRSTVVGMGVAVIGWLFGLLLVAADSEVRILGLVFDPYQLVPAALLGVLLGLTRPRLVRWIEDLASGQLQVAEDKG